jgi:hypothetical protein
MITPSVVTNDRVVDVTFNSQSINQSIREMTITVSGLHRVEMSCEE